MHPKNRTKLADRVSRAAEATLAAQNYVAPIDVLVGIGWLDAGAVKRWRQGQVEYMENPGPACLRCAGLGDLEFLPAGDALPTRRVKANSARFAVVVRFSRSRRRYERQGLLVEPQALNVIIPSRQRCERQDHDQVRR